MSRWLSEYYSYNLGKYIGLSQVGRTIKLCSQEVRRSKLDTVGRINGTITNRRWYIIADDALLQGDL